MRTLRTLLAAGALLAGAATAQAAPAPVMTQSGAVQGVEAAAVVSYKGIPYAAAPVGDLRWRPPGPAPHWQGVRAGDHFGAMCMQNVPPNVNWNTVPISEDCLFLNIWRPAAAPDSAKLPVMVWIHGGGFNLGASSWPQTEGSSLARHGVVLISLNYRMGKFGFFAHPALTRESPDGELGNYGVMDMIAALKWVKANIAAFGGDPGNVTIFGESAGGMAVDFLMESPDARGLFHKAIVESGGGRNAMASMTDAEAAGAKAAQAWNVAGDDAAALRATPAKTVLGDAGISAGGSSPMVDGKVVPELPLTAFREGRIAHVPYLIGTNAYEAGLFGGAVEGLVRRGQAQWPKVETTYDGYGSHKPELVKGEYATDMLMGEPARALARAAAAHGLPTYMYAFSYLRPSQRDGKIPGPLHFDEVYVVFGSMATAPAPVSDDPAAVEAMQSRWTDFAKTGRPGAGWPEFKAGDEGLLEFTNDGPAARKDFRKPQLDIAQTVAETTGP